MKITRRKLRKLIQEAMYSARAKRDVAIDKVGEPYAGKIKNVISQPEYGNMGNELLQSLAGYETSPDYPEATSYGEEVGQFDQKMTLSGIQHYENALTPKDKQLRKMIVDSLFDPKGNWRIPVDRLSRAIDDPKLFKMNFMMWIELFPEDYLDANNLDHSDPQYAEINFQFEESAERIFNSMGGSWQEGDGESLVPLQGINSQDQLAFNQVILKVLNNDPQYV